MIRFIYCIILLMLLSACDQVVFTEPQPSKVKEMQEIPEFLRGTYVDSDNDTLVVRSNSFSYDEDDLSGLSDIFISDSMVLKEYYDHYFLSIREKIGEEYFWLLYIIEAFDDGKKLDVYAMDPGDVVKLAKLQEITSKVRDIEDSDTEYYLFDPKKKNYKTIIRDSVFTKVIEFKRISP